MKKIFRVIAVVFLLATATASTSYGKIWIVPDNMPEWAINALDNQAYWFTDQYAYGVGVAPPMKNYSLQRTTAENRARAALLKGLGITKESTVEIRDVWKDPDTHKIYALARV